jgi:hypothetical protein
MLDVLFTFFTDTLVNVATAVTVANLEKSITL